MPPGPANQKKTENALAEGSENGEKNRPIFAV